MDELEAGGEFSFAVLPESSALLQPGEGTLHNPAFGQYDEGVEFVALWDGLNVGSSRWHMRLDHSGSVPGFYSELEYFPGTDNTVVILSNQNSFPKGQFTPGTHVIDNELMTIASDPTAPVPSEGKEALTSPRVLRLFTGKYVSDDGKQSPFTISLHGGHLQLLEEGPGHSPSELRGDYGELDFYFSDDEGGLEFSGQNEAVFFDLRHSRAFPFHRVQIGALASEDR